MPRPPLLTTSISKSWKSLVAGVEWKAKCCVWRRKRLSWRRRPGIGRRWLDCPKPYNPKPYTSLEEATKSAATLQAQLEGIREGADPREPSIPSIRPSLEVCFDRMEVIALTANSTPRPQPIDSISTAVKS